MVTSSSIRYDELLLYVPGSTVIVCGPRQPSAASIAAFSPAPPSTAATLMSGQAADAVVGTVARRFYCAGGAIQTRVYVAPQRIVVRQPRRQKKAISDALDAAALELGPAA